MDRFQFKQEVQLMLELNKYIPKQEEKNKINDCSLEELKKMKEILYSIAKLLDEKKSTYPTYYKEAKKRNKNTLEKLQIKSKHQLTRENSRKGVGNRQHANSQKVPQANSNDIWVKADNNRLFEHIPTGSEERLNILFKDLLSRKTMPVKREAHWSQHLIEPYQNTIRENSKISIKALPTPMKLDEIAPYWEKNSVKFQIEKSQRCQRTKIHCLLSSLVRCDLPESSEENQDNRQRYHPLVPYIPQDKYLSLEFDQRLELELQSLGLDPSDEAGEFEDNISSAIHQYESELAKTKNLLQEFHQTLIKRLPSIFELERKREDNLRTLKQLMNTVQNV